MKVVFKELSDTVTAAALEVYAHLGAGFLERVYSEALAHELALRGLPFQREVAVPVSYKGQPVGSYKADFVVDGKMIVELKAIAALASAHLAQARHYLAATGFPLALLLNFGAPALEFTRLLREDLIDPARGRSGRTVRSSPGSGDGV